MNKSKLISVAVLCALALGACVDDKESASVTALREAKTSYLKAQADYQSAQAEVAKINAEVAKAKAEAEAEVAKLKAQAEVAKTEAEAALLKQQAEEAAKRLEIRLAELEAKAKANAALYEKQYQEYLNELEQAKRDAEKDRNNDLKMAANEMKVVVDSIRIEEKNRDEQQLEAAKLTQKMANAIAGNVYQAKNDSIQEAVKLAANEATLLQYQTLYAADAATRKAEIEAIRAGLSDKADALEKAQLAYKAAEKEVDDLQDEMEAVPDKISEGFYEYYDQNRTFIRSEAAKVGDVVIDAWEKLNRAVIATYGSDKKLFYSSSSYSSLKGNYTEEQDLGDGTKRYTFKPDAYNFNNLDDITFYKWEAEKLLADLKAELAEDKAELTETDTLAAATKTLEKMFAQLEKAQKEDNEAKVALEAAQTASSKATEARVEAQNAFDKAQASGDQAKIQAAAATLAKAQEAETKAQEAVTKAQEVVDGKMVEGVHIDGTEGKFLAIKGEYDSKRGENESLESTINDLKDAVAANEAYVADVTEAITICFDAAKKAEIDAVKTELKDLAEKMDELIKKKAELYAAQTLAQDAYDTDKGLVEDWYSYVENPTDNEYDLDRFLASLEQNINTTKKAIEANKSTLNEYAEMLKDPNGQAFVEKYCARIAQDIETAEEAVAKAESRLQALQTRKTSLQAVIDACMVAAE